MTQRRYGSEPTPIAIAHRGGAGLAPENTVLAFETARGLGFRYMETDVQVTKDGVCVAFHDHDLRRLTGVTGPVDARTWSGMQRLRVHSRHAIPRLEDLLTAWPELCWSLDVKDPKSLPYLVRLLKGTDAVERVCIGGPSDRFLSRVREELGARVTTALNYRCLGPLLAGRYGHSDGGFVHLPADRLGIPVATSPVLRRLHRLGYRALVWTVNSPNVMRTLLDHGADGIVTDRPDLLRTALDARGLW